ncbi:MAG: tetratricopeptide repeat protein [Gammaproteobacteria bacterium]|nr:tetratricopeptide repeat protein [Gammaproteobacteria bacterium]
MPVSPKDLSNKLLPGLLLLCGLISSSLLVYWPGLNGGFLLDDFDNLQRLNHYGGVTSLDTAIHFIFSNTSGSLGRPVSMLSFLINDQYWPGDSRPFKYTNLMIHIICGLLILQLTLRLLPCTSLPRQYHFWVASFVSAVWLLHPLNLSTTLYVIQRMTQLMTLFTLVGLILYCAGRIHIGQRTRQGLTLMTLGIVFFGALATLSKENGVLILLYVAILEYTFFRHLPKPAAYRRWFVIFIVIPGLLFLGYIIKSIPGYLNVYEARAFTPIERLLTETRILIDYLGQILLPRIKGTGLIHDDIVLSQGLLTPISTLFSLTLIATLLIVAFRSRIRHPILTLAVFWYFGGHLLESTFLPLELYFEHRNYLPMVGPLLAVGYYLAVLAEKFPRKRVQVALKVTPVILVVFSGLLTYQSAKVWGSTIDLIAVWAYEHPDSLRAQRVYGQVLGKLKLHDVAIKLLDKTYKKHPEDVGLPIAMLGYACASNVSPHYSVEDIIRQSSYAEHNGGLKTIIQTFVTSTFDENCEFVSRQDIHELLTAMENINGIKGAAMAQLLLLHADIYTLEGQLSPAIQLLDKALEFHEDTIIPVQQARLLASAGLYDESLKYLKIAFEIERKKPQPMQLRIPMLNHLKTKVSNAKSVSTSHEAR